MIVLAWATAWGGTPPFDTPFGFDNFVDIDGQFTLGEAPNRVTFLNGLVTTIGDQRVYLDFSPQAFMVREGETAAIEFETPGEELEFFIRGQFNVTVRARLFDEDDALILSRTAEAGSEWVQVSFSSGDFGNRAVQRVELVNVAGGGFGALENMTYCARAQAPPPPPEFDNAVHFAQFGDGNGLTSQILLENRSGVETLVRVELFGDDGNPLMVELNGQPVDGTLELTLPPTGLRFLETDGLSLDTVTGAVTVRSEEPLAGVILFGGAFGLAGVGATGDFSNGFTAPIDSRFPDLRTGVAVQNLDESPNTLTMCLLSLDAQVVATAEVTLPGLGHNSSFVDEFDWDTPPDFSNFRGILRVTVDGDVAATAIQLRPGQFASLPVTEIEDMP